MQKRNQIEVIGIDPSLRNWGLAKGFYDLDDDFLIISDLSLVRPVLDENVKARKSSLDLSSACQLSFSTLNYIQGAKAIFAEIPIGSQSARAMAQYGICIGVLGAVRASGKPFFQLTPTEVKLAATGSKTASKQEMIEWATYAHPEASWPRQKGKIIGTQAEHLADAIATIHAGLNTKYFQQFKYHYMNKEQVC